MPPREVFLSHSSRDGEMARSLADVLKAHDVPIYYSPQNIVGGQQWQNEILAALQRCDWFTVLLSPDAVKSMWVQREVAIVLKEPRFENRIVPLAYRSCNLGTLGWLSVFQTVDFSTDFAEGCRHLLRIWGVGARDELLT